MAFTRVGLGLLAVVVLAANGAQARELGIDVSHWQGEGGMSQTTWNAMAAAGKSFAYIKATEGLLPPGNIDTAQPNNSARATSAGVLNGVYHFARPDNRPSISGAIAEADHFVTTAGSAMMPGHLRPALDLERGLGGANPLTATQLTDWVLAFVGRVVELKGPEAEPIVYTTMGYASTLDTRIAHLDSWIVDLSSANPHTGSPLTTGRFDDWLVWQYSHTGSAAGIAPLDLNVFHSELAPLSSLVIVPEPAALSLLLVVPACCRRRRNRSKRSLSHS